MWGSLGLWHCGHSTMWGRAHGGWRDACSAVTVMSCVWVQRLSPFLSSRKPKIKYLTVRFQGGRVFKGKSRFHVSPPRISFVDGTLAGTLVRLAPGGHPGAPSEHKIFPAARGSKPPRQRPTSTTRSSTKATRHRTSSG